MNSTNNLLVSGYIREDKYNIKLQIPQVITNSIGLYCREYLIQMLGLRHSIPCSDFRVFLTDTPKIVTGFDVFDDKIIDIQYGSKHKLFLTSKGNVYGLGENGSGQLGLGPNVKQVNTPTMLPFNDKIKAIACGELHSLFLDINGKLLVCGFNYCMQLGMNFDREKKSSCDENVHDFDADSSSSSFEMFVNDLAQRSCVFEPIYNTYFENLNIRFKSIHCGNHHSLCITTNGKCFTFGYNGYGNLGNGQSTEWGEGDGTPYKLDMNKSFKTGICGENCNILLTKNNDIVVFGDNSNNQCSIQKQKQFEKPSILSKENEFGITENSFIEQIVDNNNKIFFVVDLYKRCIKIE